MNLHQRGTSMRSDREERARIGALLVDLQRSLEAIRAEIEIEARQTRWSCPDDLVDFVHRDFDFGERVGPARCSRTVHNDTE